MKRLKNLSVLFVLVSLLLVSCSKDDDDGGGDPNPNLQNYFACKIDGVDWEADGIDQPTVTLLTPATDVSAKRLDFSGSADGTTIAVVINDYRNADQGECLNEETFYGTDDADASNAFSVTAGNGSVFVSDAYIVVGTMLTREGTIEITNCEEVEAGKGKISGTFSFTVKDLTGAVVHEVTEGEFVNVDYDFF